jgi:hypothetical protein
LELKCKSYERNKKTEKEKEKKEIRADRTEPAQPARHPRRLVRRILRAVHVALSPHEPARVSPIFFYFPYFQNLSPLKLEYRSTTSFSDPFVSMRS